MLLKQVVEHVLLLSKVFCRTCSIFWVKYKEDLNLKWLNVFGLEGESYIEETERRKGEGLPALGSLGIDKDSVG